MASANFNTEILSSNSEKKIEYNLDDVIDKDFEGPYRYTLNSDEVPIGVSIIQNGETFQWFLAIPPKVTFKLVITVTNNDKSIVVEASTIVTIDGVPSFLNEVNKFIENPNYTQNKEQVAGNWSTIISERISSGDLKNDPVRPK